MNPLEDIREFEFLGVHLGGSAQALLITGPKLVEMGVRTFQVSLSNPRRFDMPDGTLLDEFLNRCVNSLSRRDFPNPRLNLVVHGPFATQLGKEAAYKFNFEYFVQAHNILYNMARKYDFFNSISIVAHVGSYPKPPLEPIDGLRTMGQFLTAWNQVAQDAESSIYLCIENDAGSKNNTKMGRVSMLYKVLLKLNLSNVRMCLDTEHAYANGFSIEDFSQFKQAVKVAKVVHLNSIPNNVIKSHHLDRHSETLIKDGKHASALYAIARYCQDKSIPMILERDLDLVVSDMVDIMSNVQPLILGVITMSEEDALLKTLNLLENMVSQTSQYIDEQVGAMPSVPTFKNSTTQVVYDSYGEVLNEYHKVCDTVTTLSHSQVKLRQLRRVLSKASMLPSLQQSVKYRIENLLNDIDLLRQSAVVLKDRFDATLRFYGSAQYIFGSNRYSELSH